MQVTRFDRAAAIAMYALFAICTTLAVVANIPFFALAGIAFLIVATFWTFAVY